MKTSEFKWKSTDLLSVSNLEEFPGLVMKSRGARVSEGAPMAWEYEVFGPVDQIQAFLAKHGNGSLMSEYQHALALFNQAADSRRLRQPDGTGKDG